MNTMIRNSFLIILLKHCLFYLPARNKKHRLLTPPTPVNLYTVKSQTVLYYDNYPATTAALSQVDLRPQIQGYNYRNYFLQKEVL